MKKKLHMISSVICIVMLCVALCVAFAGCSKTSVQLQNELGALLEGGGFEKGSSLVTDLIETAGEKGQEIISLLEGQNYDKDGEVSIYDIFVAKDGKEVQPNEKVKEAKRDGLIDAFLFGTVTEQYMAAVMDSL